MGEESSLIAPGHPLPWPCRCALALCFALLLTLATRQVGSLDVGFHLKAGEHILQGNGWPRTDPFTFTINDHPYTDTSWGYQVLLALTYLAGGAGGAAALVLLHAALVLGVFLIVYRTCRLTSVDPTTLAVLMTAGVIASEMRYEVRPELLSWFFLALVLHILHRHAEGLSSPLPALAAIHLVWANCHGLFILGWGALACFAVGSWIRRGALDRRLATWGFISAAVTMINPYGWRGVVFPFTLATRLSEENAFGQSIGELVSPFNLGLSDQLPFYPRAPIWTFRLLFVLAVIALIPLLRRKRYDSALASILFLYLSARMIRNIPLMVVACLPGIIAALPAGGMMKVMGLRKRPRLLVTRAAIAAICLVSALIGLRAYHDAYYIASRRPERFGLGWNREVLPIGAAEYAVRAGLDGPMLNHLNFGGYLMWARPRPVFIDGRLEVVREEFYAYYQRVLTSEADLEACVAKYGIEWIVFPYATSPKLLARLSKDSRWRLAYVDAVATIFVRDGPRAVAFIDPALSVPGPGLSPPPAALPGLDGAPRRGALARWIDGLLHRQVFPSENFNRGLFHYYRGESDLAQARFAAGIMEAGGSYYELYNNLGSVLYQKRRLKEAGDCYRVVLRDDPGNRLAVERLAAISRTGGSH